MKFRKIFGVASLAATLTTTGVLGGFASTVGANDAIPMYRPGEKPEDVKVAFTKSVSAPKDVNASEIPSLWYQFELSERIAGEDVYVAGDPVEMYAFGGINFASYDDAMAALKIEIKDANPTWSDDQVNTEAESRKNEITKVDGAFKQTVGGSMDTYTSRKFMNTTESRHTKDISVFIDPANAEEFTATNNAGRQGNTPTQKKTDGDVTYYRHETENFLTGLTFDKEGVYAYDVIETQSAWKAKPFNSANKWTNVDTEPNPNPNADGSWVEQSIVLSKQRYRLYIYTENVGTASAPDIRIWAMTAVEVDYETGKIVKGEKKDMTQGGSTNVDGDLSNVQFDNAYRKVNHYGKNPQLAGYGVQKNVAGVKNAKGKYIEGGANADYDDQAILFGKTVGSVKIPAEQFDFDVTITRNSMYAEDTNYTAYIVASSTGGSSWKYVSNDGSLTDDITTNTKKVTFTFSDTKNADTQKVTLSHYQKLAFDNIPVGTTYSVVEADYADGGKLYGDNTKFTPDVAANKLKFIKTTVNGTDVTGTLKTEGAVPNDPFTSVYVNNAKQGDTATGIITNILPFLVIIGGAVVALIVAVVVKGKRRSQEAQ